jgi:alkanesulfonate monooxygenase SsuD/methylene tetrahydromethanopterin reductase-like flavin-dependent oxidoreductase (luciferase family)
MVSVHPVEFATTGFCAAFRGAEVARESEELGFDVQLFGENHAMAADVFGEMRAAAAATRRIRLLCGPVNFVTRDPGVIASAIAPVQIASHGRALCGIARGDSAVALAGRRPQRQADLERDLGILRAYLMRETVDFGVRQSRLEWIGELAYVPVPIELVCSGPRAIELAARRADRIGLSVGGDPGYVRQVLELVDRGLAASGRSRADVRIGAYLPVSVTSDRASGRAALRRSVAGWAHMSSFPGIDLSRQPEMLRRATEKLRHAYDYRFHRADAPAENTNTRLIDEDFADWFGIGGPASYVAERLAALVELGVNYGTALVGAERERFARDVMPPVRAAGR